MDGRARGRRDGSRRDCVQRGAGRTQPGRLADKGRRRGHHFDGQPAAAGEVSHACGIGRSQRDLTGRRSGDASASAIAADSRGSRCRSGLEPGWTGAGTRRQRLDPA